MTRRRIRRLLIVAGLIGGIKAFRDLHMARNRQRSPAIIDGMASSAPVKPLKT